jgi:hypothetical protein
MRAWIITLFAIVVAATSAAAQAPPSSPPTPAPSPVRRPAPDFYFGRPAGAVAIRGGWLFSRASSDWYDFVTDQLTLNRRDFNAPAFAADVGMTMTDRLQATVGVDFNQASTTSEYRRFVDNNRQPINQSTKMKQASVTGGVRYALTAPGRRISSLAWIPHTVTPYVTAGGGAVWYSLSQTGDFVDFVDLSVFTDVLHSDGWAPEAHAGGGVDVRVLRRVFATFDARYRWAAAGLSRQWVNFDPVDLSGLRLSAGINVPF